MEGSPYFPESSQDEEEDSSIEIKDKKDSKEKKLSIFEKKEKQDDDEKNPEKNKDDKSEKVDKEPPLEKLSDDEKTQIASETVSVRKSDVKQELESAPADSSDEHEALVGATFLETLDEELDNGVELDDALDNAEQKTLEITDLEQEIDDNVEISDKDSDDDSSTPISIPFAPSANTPIPPTNNNPNTPPNVPTPPTPPNLPTPPTPPAGPPTPPTPNFYNTPPTPPNNFNSLNTNQNLNPNVIVVPDRRREVTHLLVGGLLGYLIGRRRGRINTEKKLIPVQQKLEKEVTSLQLQILEREEKLRTIARVNSLKNPDKLSKTIEHIEEVKKFKKLEQTQSNPNISPEKFGRFIVRPETNQVNSNKLKNVEIMSTAELVEIASSIKIQNSHVAKLYETGRINRTGLERIVKAFLNGEKYEKLISDNLLTPEIYDNPEELNQVESNVDINPEPKLTAKEIIANKLESAGLREQSSQMYIDERQQYNASKNSPVVPGIIAGLVITIIFLFLVFS